MGIEADIRIDRPELRRLVRNLDRVERRQIRKAMRASLNDVAKRVRTDTVRETSAGTSVPQKEIRKRVRIRPSTIRNLLARVWCGTFPISLKRLKPVQQKSGVRAGKHKRKGAFISEALGGHVFKRDGASRLPISKQTVSIHGHAAAAIRSSSRARMARTLPKVFRRKLEFFINRAALARRG